MAEVILPIRTVWAQAKRHIRIIENKDHAQQANDVIFDNDAQILYISYGTKDADNIGDDSAESSDGYI
ncbi:MAG: hypothetical protein ACK5MI_04445 [Mangrovibacterium sp.]